MVPMSDHDEPPRAQPALLLDFVLLSAPQSGREIAGQ